MGGGQHRRPPLGVVLGHPGPDGAASQHGGDEVDHEPRTTASSRSKTAASIRAAPSWRHPAAIRAINPAAIRLNRTNQTMNWATQWALCGNSFRTPGQGRSYWVFRYRFGGREREFSIGPYPEIDLARARVEHVKLRKRVVADKIDPLAEKQAAK
jgi:hypothetical protein